ncbi:enoyl-CoA hydratase-related protein [Nesterenkonia alba]|uniref:enoyl-CoA hydratase-related protein n=1 Tax=Nesterenkonia alba TaxID=515814 RepID=UPI0003B49E59|nr:enoyl-CoA hydratase-related protein [Nesterenkonia alba]
MSEYSTITTRTTHRVTTIELNRPEALNALNRQLMEEVLSAARAAETDEDVGAVLLTGSAKAFAAGADITEMAAHSSTSVRQADIFSGWDQLAQLRIPIVAAVRGYALGGGCELAMIADVIIAGESAQFGQPEITLGIIPGIGGTQRLARTVGKATAMDMVLTGRRITAAEAETMGLVSRVVADDDVVTTATDVAEQIAHHPGQAVRLGKEAVLAAFNTPLEQGLHYERRLFETLFDTEDQAEGMAAFTQKRRAEFRHR